MIDINDVLVFLGLALFLGGVWLMAGWPAAMACVGVLASVFGTLRQMPRRG